MTRARRHPATGLAIAMAAVLLAALPAPRLGAAPHFPVPGWADAGPRPRSLLLPEDVAAIRGRAGREPYRTFVARIHALALQDHDPADDTVRTGHERANTARSAALLFLLDLTVDGLGQVGPFPDAASRRAMGERAAAHLLTMNTESYAKGLLDATLDIHTAQELHLWADTLDLLLGAEQDVLGPDREAAIQRVADLAADFYADYAITNWVVLRAYTANHRSKSSAALGIAALVLNGETFEAPETDGRYEPAAWIDLGLRYTDLVVRDLQADPDGGFQEGPGYLEYSGIDHLPFYWTWHHLTGGASFELRWDAPMAPWYAFHASGVETIPAPFTAPWLGRQLDWLVRLILPDGSLPAIDDTSPGGRFCFAPFVRAEIPNASLYRWAWERMGMPTDGSVDLAPLSLVAFEDQVAAADPEAMGWGRHQALPRAGQLMLRSGWGPDDVAVLLLAEHGTAAGWTQTRWGDFVDGAAGHEHPDGASFSLFAYGEALALDPGYLGWENHAVVHRPEHHNLLLVDGKGADINRYTVPSFTFDEEMQIVLTDPTMEGGYAPARDGMAWLVRWDLETPRVAYGEIVTRYSELVPETVIRRRATLLADRFLVLHDRASPTAQQSGDHDFTFQLHGHGGGTSGGDFLLEPEGATWTRSRARLVVRVTSDAPVTFTPRESTHDPGWRVPLTHTTLDATVRGSEASFLALLAPEPVPAGDATLLEAASGDCPGPCLRFSAPGVRCFAWQGFAHPVTLEVGGSPLLEAGWGAYCEEAGGLAGTFGALDTDPESLVTARFEIDAAGALRGFEVTLLGHGADRERGEVLLPLPAGAGIAGACAVSAESSRYRVEAPLGARLRTVAGAPPASPFPARLGLAGIGPGEPAVLPLGEPATVTASESCPPGSALEVAFTLLERPEKSTVSLPTGSQTTPSTTFLPDLPGLYRVEAHLASGGATALASLAFEVEGEVPWPAAPDAGAPDSGDATPMEPGPGCGCAAGGRGTAGSGAALLFFAILLGIVRRRGTR